MKIEVRPVPDRKPWHKKTQKESFTSAKKIQALLDAKTHTYATGLSKEDIEHLTNTMKVGYDLSNIYNANVPHPFWDSTMSAFKLENRTMIFDETSPLDYIRIRLMRVSKYVANSLSVLDDFPDATHVIYDERAEAEGKAEGIEIKKAAIIGCTKISKDRKIQIILVLEGKNLKGSSDAFVEVALDKVLTKRPEEVLRMLETEPKALESEALVLEAVNKGVLTKKGGKISYFETPLGYTEKDVADFFLLDANQELMLIIKEAVNK